MCCWRPSPRGSNSSRRCARSSERYRTEGPFPFFFARPNDLEHFAAQRYGLSDADHPSLAAMRVRLRQQRLLEFLAQSRLSQNHWALKLGLSRGHWSEIVNG